MTPWELVTFFAGFGMGVMVIMLWISVFKGTD